MNPPRLLRTLIAGKFRHPTGLLGRLAGKAMASGNRKAVEWTVARLEIAERDSVLEVGFGPGVGIECAARRATGGRVCGVDRSPTMVDVARRRNVAAVLAGRVDLREADAMQLPYASLSFDKVFSVHCIYFWSDPVRTLEELRRVLAPGGRIAITVLPKTPWLETKTKPPEHLFTLYEASEIVELLEDAGFRDVRLEHDARPERLRCECITGVR
ncbi:MAG TPA: class I SAM-dependent methyltransferase [Rhodanobacteraceae bacterium]|nr:class I SAM-dependent methyltransferase [Rhodanobacteraceae bacterium]